MSQYSGPKQGVAGRTQTAVQSGVQIGRTEAEFGQRGAASPPLNAAKGNAPTSLPGRVGTPGAVGVAPTDRGLVERVFDRCHLRIESACAASSVPTAFLAALTANESGGNPDAARFEPAVYRHLKAVAAGETPAYAGVSAQELGSEVVDRLHPKADEFHPRYLTSPFGANHAEELAELEDDVLRELATSWGFTQIMGYHVVGRGRNVRDLLDPDLHYRIALELLAEFAHDYKLDVQSEFEEMFRCWNTGQPYGKTYDPAYVEKGMRRMSIYREISECAAPGGKPIAENGRQA